MIKIDLDKISKNELATILVEKDKEIERLKLELSGYRQAILQDKEMLGLKQENERLNNIIKEAREYIEENTRIDKINKDKRCFKLPSQAMNILEILDKENN